MECFLHLLVFECTSVNVSSQSQPLTPLWQVCGPSPPPTSPSAACPSSWKRWKTVKTDRHLLLMCASGRFSSGFVQLL